MAFIWVEQGNINLAPPVILTPSNAILVGISSPTPQQFGRPAFSKASLNSTYDAVNQFSTSANSS